MLQKRLEQYDTALYVRLSKEDGDAASGSKNESNSIANQKSLIMDYLQSRPEFRVVSIREDDGFSGTDFNRPAFQAMMEDVKKGVIKYKYETKTIIIYEAPHKLIITLQDILECLGKMLKRLFCL